MRPCSGGDERPGSARALGAYVSDPRREVRSRASNCDVRQRPGHVDRGHEGGAARPDVGGTRPWLCRRLGLLRLHGSRRPRRARRIRRHREKTAIDSNRLADHFLANVAPSRNVRVAGYWPIEAEFDVRPLLNRLHRLGNDLCLPTVAENTKVLSFRSWRPCDPLEPASFGTLVPSGNSREVVPQMLIVPLIAFDERGHRLGYGGGYYDCTLSALTASGAVSVGVAFEDQLVSEVPSEIHDIPLDWIITEERARRTRDTLRVLGKDS